MNEGRPIRPLIIAEGANPVLTSASLVGWSCATAVAKITNSHLVTEERNRLDFEKAGLTSKEFTAINSRRAQGLAWKLSKLLSGGKSFGWSLYAIFSNLAYPFFERAVWREFEGALRAGEFDLVHRILPLSPTTPSWLARRLHSIGVPLVVGPLNGGVPWPEGFDEVRRQERDWAGRLRHFYQYLPGVSSTRKHSRAIIAGARTTWREIPAQYHDRCVFIPENAIDPTRFPVVLRCARRPGPLRLAFVGRLVALKGVDMLLAAAAPLAREGKVVIDIIGDGPEMSRLRKMVVDENIGTFTKLDGWQDHSALQPRLRESDLFVFPSIREFGGGAVLEAMALGLPPVVLDHGGPPELVPPGTGWALPLARREQIVADLRGLLESLAEDPLPLAAMGVRAQKHIQKYYTWDAKAAQILEVYRWVLGHRTSKPEWGMPMGFSPGIIADSVPAAAVL